MSMTPILICVEILFLFVSTLGISIYSRSEKSYILPGFPFNIGSVLDRFLSYIYIELFLSYAHISHLPL
jgi:hypothetical protein